MKVVKQIISVLLKAGISAALLWYLFRQVDKRSLFEIISHANKSVLFCAFCVFTLMYIFSLLRWKMLLDAVDIKLPLKRVAISFSGGVFFNLFLPSSIGGDFMRSVDLASHTKKARQVVATVFLDRLSGYVGLVLMVVFALTWGWKLVADNSVLTSVISITGVLIVILLVLFNKFIYSKINNLLKSPNAGRARAAITNLHHELHLFRNKKKLMCENILFSILIQIIGPVSFYIIARAIGIKVNFIYFLIFLPIIGAITMLPISIGGLGLRDASTIYLFAKAGVPKDLAFAMSLLNFSFILACGVIGGLIYVFTVHHRRLQRYPRSDI
jgi:hypothetical protein